MFHHRLRPFVLSMPFILSVDSLPPVPRLSRRLTFRFDVLGRPLTVQPVSHVFKVPCLTCFCINRSSPAPLSLIFACPQAFFFTPQVPTPIQCRRANPRLPCQRRSSPFVSPFVFTSSRLPSSYIPFTSLDARGLVLIGLITSLLLYISSTSIYPYLPRYSLRGPSSILSYLASPGS